MQIEISELNKSFEEIKYDRPYPKSDLTED